VVKHLKGAGRSFDPEDPVALRGRGALADRHIGCEPNTLIIHVLKRIAVGENVEGKIRGGRKHVIRKRAADREHHKGSGNVQADRKNFNRGSSPADGGRRGRGATRSAEPEGLRALQPTDGRSAVA